MVVFARCSFILLCACCSFAGAAPIVNVRLSPPASIPGMGDEVDKLEGARRSMESAALQKLDVAFRDAVRDAEARIEGLLRSLLQKCCVLSCH